MNSGQNAHKIIISSLSTILIWLSACNATVSVPSATTTDLPTETTTLKPTRTPTSTLTPTFTTTPVPTNPVDGANLIHIPAGEFTMGSDLGRSSEKPVHYVFLDAFWLYETEVTNQQFAKFVTETGYRTDAEKDTLSYVYEDGEWRQVYGANWAHPLGPESTVVGLENYPVEQVSWNDAFVYCKWAGGRLPTEAEWEKGARGDDGRIYPWGNEWHPEFLNSWDSVDGYDLTSPVGSFPEGASPYGVMDMAGNVGEWVADIYNVYYYGYSSSINPQGPGDGEIRSKRGGAWIESAPSFQTFNRTGADPSRHWNTTGFRCAVTDNSPQNVNSDSYVPRPYVPTSTQTPLSLPYEENFEDGKADNWTTYNGNWTIAEEGSNHFWIGTGPENYPQAWINNTTTWTDYAFETRIRIKRGGVFICIRGDGSFFYNVYVNRDNTDLVFAEYLDGKYETFGQGTISLEANKWYAMRFEVENDDLRFYIDNKLVINSTRESISNGGIGYYMGGGNEVHFDDIKVWSLEQ